MGKTTTRSTFSLLLFLSGAFIFLTAFQSSELTVTASITNVVCPGASTGSIDVTVSGGVEPYTYSWTGPGSFTSNSPDLSNLAAGTYTLTVTDEAETPATLTEQFTVDQVDTEKPASVTLPDVTGQCSATATAPTTTDNCAGTIIGITTDPLSYDTQGTYTIRWKFDDGNGNIYTTTQNVIVDDTTKPEAINLPNVTGECAATATAPTTTDNCAGTITGTTTDPLSYSTQGTHTINWSFNDGNGNIYTTTQNVVVDDVTKPQAVTLPDVTGECAATATAPTTTDNCAGTITGTTTDPLSYTTQGTYKINWSFDDGNGNIYTTTQNVVVNDVTKPEAINLPDVTGECSAAATAPTTTDNCAGTITGTTTDPLSYTTQGTHTINWTFDDGNGNITIVPQNIVIDDITKPTPPVLENITWGCSYTVTTPVASDNCTGTVTGTTTDALTYSTPGTHVIDWIFDDGNGNTSTTQQTVTIDPVEATADVVNVACNGFSTGEITVTGSGGKAPYTYTWTTLGSGPTKSNLAAGTYHVVVKDSNGCESTPLAVTISEPDTFIEITDISYTAGCYQQNDATATVQVTGGTGNYSYLWDDGQTSQTATGLTPGIHSITVTDENGCNTTKEINIPAPDQLLITSFSTTETTAFGTATGTATANVSGGTAPYSFSWSTGDTTQTAKNLTAGTYTLTITDANGCTYQKSVTIIDPLETDIIPTSMCLSDDGGIRTSTFEAEFVRGGTAPYTYTWDFGADAIPAAAGPIPQNNVHVVEYSATGNKIIRLTVTDANGLSVIKTFDHYVGECFEACGKTGNLDLNLNTFYIGKEDQTPLTSGECASYTGKKYIYLKVEKNANAYNPSVEFIYTISDGTTVVDTQEITGCVDLAAAGVTNGKIPEVFRVGEVTNWACGYAVAIQNFYMSWTNSSNKQCGDVRKMMCISTNENDEIQFPLHITATVNHLLCNGAATGTITATAIGGVGSYMYQLKDVETGDIVRDWQSSNIFSGLNAGNYVAAVKDGATEIATTTQKEILEPANPLRIETPVTKVDVTCHGASDGSATVTVTGGTPFETGNPYIYVWSNSQTTPTATGLTAGNHTVEIIDANGCTVTETITIVQPEVRVANAGNDKILPCGVSSTSLGTEISEEEIGSWQIINGPAGGTIAAPDSTKTTFSGAIGTYTLRWTESCGSTDDIRITIKDCSTVDFDGVDDYITFGDNYDLTGSFSVEAWVKLKSTTEIKTILSKRNGTNLTTNGYDLIIENGVPKFRWNEKSLISAYPIGTDRWYHLSVVSDASSVKMYIDGIEVISEASAVPVENEYPFLIGAIHQVDTIPVNYFHGWIEEVRIWNTALAPEQLRFMMNQRIINNGGLVKGMVVPLNVPGSLSWSNLTGYYYLDVVENGYVSGKTATSIRGKVRNITTVQERSAPLPYTTKRSGNWRNIASTSTPWLYGTGIWDAPNSTGVNNDTIKWNIVKLSNDVNSATDVTVLGLISEDPAATAKTETLKVLDFNSLRITEYLELDGAIDLVGESQLLQDSGSILAESSSGYIERDQQGTRSSYNYNYWSSPVSTIGAPNNSGYTIAGVLHDGTNPANPQEINFGSSFQHADGGHTTPIKISSFWLNIYTDFASNTYSAWKRVGPTGDIEAGEGFTMKGSSGTAAISDRQNYVFIGKPNNGMIELNLTQGNDYLVGNPYPSAIDSHKFILDNINDSGGTNGTNVFSGTLYFWDHFGGKSHYLKEYIGGYATLNLSGGIVAVATDERINATGEEAEEESKPQRYIPVGQAFYISTKLAPQLSEVTTVSGGMVEFNNSQRVFETDDQAGDESVFKSRSKTKADSKVMDERSKIWIRFSSPAGYHRQLLVTKDPLSSSGFDLGFDAPLIEHNKEDMYWMIDSLEFVIQGVPDLHKERELALGIKTAVEGEFSIAIDELKNIPDEVEIYIKDSLTQKRHDLRKSNFVATDTAGVKNNRYFLVFQPKPIADSGESEEEEEEEEQDEGEDEKPDGEGGTEDENPDEDSEVGDSTELSLHYSNKDEVMVIQNPNRLPLVQGTIYNVLGQVIQVFNDVPQESEVKLPVVQHPKGVYIMKLQLENGHKSIKFIMD